MTDITRQQFLTELGKLLTFMYEEDRQTALSMYGKMFDDAEDEQALIQRLASPTRQAVVVARAYDAKERKLQVQSQSREDNAEREVLPDFVLAIHQIYEDVLPREEAAAAALPDQVSLFEPAVAEPDFPDLPDTDGAAAPETATPFEDAVTETVEVVVEAVETAVTEPEPELSADGDTGIFDGGELLTAGPRPLPDEVDGFLEDFHIEGDELIDEAAPFADETAAETAPDEDEFLFVEADAEPAMIRQPKSLLLVLFWVLGIPVILLGIALLLIPTLFCLGAAVGLVAAGSATLIAAFSGFAVIADILLVLGVAIILLALGLLFLWLFVWFIGGAMVGLVKGVIALSRNWCYEEVPA